MPKCAYVIVVPVVGTTPPSSFRRRCKRNAATGEYCTQHAKLEGITT